MENKYGIVFMLVMVVTILLGLCFITDMSIKHQKQLHNAYIDGYKKAYMDYKTDTIDCIVRVKFPKWLEESKEWQK